MEMEATLTKTFREDVEEKTDGPLPEDKGSSDNSEYDSADAESYSDDEEDKNVKVRSRASDKGEHTNSDDGSFTLEREEGDGQESVPNKKIDDDEDKKNPQYIPKRGTFYEHDDRTLEDNEEIKEPEVEDKDKEGKKKVWQDKKEKWSHDRFNEPEQAPKSRAELIAIYGYDIRNEEGPPRARRRRKYGRGPNKYTRNWEDEDAYNKPAPIIKNKGKKPVPRNDDEEFPELGRNSGPNQNYEQRNYAREEEEPHVTKAEIRKDYTREKPVTNFSRIENSFNVNPQDNYKSSQDNYNKSSQDNYNKSSHDNYNKTSQDNYNKSSQHRIGSGRINNSSKELSESEYKGFTTTGRNNRNKAITNQKVLPPRNQSKEEFIQSQNFYLSNKSNQDLEKEMSKLNIDEGSRSIPKNNYNTSNSSGQQRQNSVPPRMQSEQKGSKRYSSMRQKSLPETNNPPLSNYQHGGPSFYSNEYNQQSVPSPTQPLLHPNPQILASTQVAHVPPLQQAPLTPVPVTAAPLLQATTFAPQGYPQPPPTFIQPAAVAGPPFLPPPQTTQLINFVQTPATFQPNYPSFQQPFNSVTPPAELYQPQGGITYYSTDQQLAQRQVPQKRPKAAIPIIAPPSYEKSEEYIDNQGNNSQLENTDNLDLQQCQ